MRTLRALLSVIIAIPVTTEWTKWLLLSVGNSIAMAEIVKHVMDVILLALLMVVIAVIAML